MAMNTSNDDLNHELSSPLMKKIHSLEAHDLQSTVEAKFEHKGSIGNLRLEAAHSEDAHSGDESPFEPQRLEQKDLQIEQTGLQVVMTTSRTDVDTKDGQRESREGKTRIAVVESYASGKAMGLPRSKQGSAQAVSRANSALRGGKMVIEGTSLTKVIDSRERQSPAAQDLNKSR